MKIIKINPADNVAVAIEPLKAGETIDIEGQRITLNNDVPAGHKILLSDLVEGENVIKYGYPIGHLKESHQQGDWVSHDHIQTNLAGLLDYEYQPVGKEELTNPAYEEWFPKEQLTFQGYRRNRFDSKRSRSSLLGKTQFRRSLCSAIPAARTAPTD